MHAFTIAVNEPLEAELARIVEAHGRSLRPGPIWHHVSGPVRAGVDHGWKLHISARPDTLHTTLERALPVLLGAECEFKVVSSAAALRELNGSQNRAGAVGKALTVYPRQDAIVPLGHALADVLVGLAGPLIRSDRRVRSDAPVYYRHGPFRSRYRCKENGDLELVLIGPDGETFPGLAGPVFTCPPWASDPFAAAPAEGPQPDTAAPALLGGRYRVTGGVVQSARGAVFRALDTRTGDAVVIKLACAFVGEEEDGSDVRALLRNERRVLEALAELPCVPRVLDHFHHGDDEFLVLSSVGDTDLRTDVADHGPYGTAERPSLDELASGLLELLDAVHARGVVVRDLAPKNVVLGDGGGLSLVDFDIASLDGVQRRGFTPGYAPPDQDPRRHADVTRDYYALGATLFYAATGLEPIRMSMADEPRRDALRTRMSLRAARPADDAVVGVIGGLLSDEPEERAGAAAALRLGSRPPAPSRLPGLPVITARRLERIIDQTVQASLRDAERLLGDERLAPTNAYLGTSGLLLELLHHVGTDKTVGALARRTAMMLPAGQPAPGLLFGTTGAAIAITAAGAALDDLALSAAGATLARRELETLARVERDDYVGGVAGVALGHLILASMGAGAAHLAAADACVRRLVAGDVMRSADRVEPAAGRRGLPATELGFAHGAAGIAYCLLAHAGARDDAGAAAAGRELLGMIEGELPRLLAAAALPVARPMNASWCQGLAGVGTAMVQAATLLGEERYLELAGAAADACLALVPRMPVVSQCCGVAGVGELLVDLGAATGETRRFDQASHVLAVILSRCGGELDAPAFPDHSLMASSSQWAVGTPGVLSFLRRLRDEGGPRILMADWRPPAAVPATLREVA